jgi:exopolysaccharide biosynthesis WecB/TagA/CpsF family protein
MNHPIAMLGAAPGSLADAVALLQKEFPRARFALIESPAMGFDPTSEEGRALLERIRDSGARLCFLAFGVPKQEILASRGRDIAPQVGFVSVGAGIDFISGYQTRAPRLMQRLCLEWVWRLLSDPRRLASRYLTALVRLPAFALSSLANARGSPRPSADGQSSQQGENAVSVCYFVNQYPAGSHTFVRREIHAVERCGTRVLRASLRGWDAKLSDPGDKAELQRTRFVLREPPLRIGAAIAYCLRRRPSGLARAIGSAFRMSRGSERPFYHLFYLIEACVLARWLLEERVDHLHAHFGTNSAEVATLSHLISGVPYSFTVHGPGEFDRALQLAFPEKIRHARFVCAISSFGRSQLYRWVGHELWPKIKVVRCGLELDRLDVRALPTQARRRLVCVGRICEQKGQLLLVEAIGKLAAEGVDCELAIVGDGEMRAEVERLSRRLGIADRIRITGWLSNSGVEDEIAAARALILTSFAEGSPVAIMEALALGRPVVTTYVAGIPELVDPSCGWLVPAGDVDAIVAAVRKCLELPDAEIVRMGHAGRARVSQMHDVEREAEKLVVEFHRSVGRAWRRSVATIAEADRPSDRNGSHQHALRPVEQPMQIDAHAGGG